MKTKFAEFSFNVEWNELMNRHNDIFKLSVPEIIYAKAFFFEGFCTRFDIFFY